MPGHTGLRVSVLDPSHIDKVLMLSDDFGASWFCLWVFFFKTTSQKTRSLRNLICFTQTQNYLIADSH